MRLRRARRLRGAEEGAEDGLVVGDYGDDPLDDDLLSSGDEMDELVLGVSEADVLAQLEAADEDDLDR